MVLQQGEGRHGQIGGEQGDEKPVYVLNGGVEYAADKFPHADLQGIDLFGGGHDQRPHHKGDGGAQKPLFEEFRRGVAFAVAHQGGAGQHKEDGHHAGVLL